MYIYIYNCVYLYMRVHKGVDNVGARGALAPPDFQCVNMYKALNI